MAVRRWPRLGSPQFRYRRYRVPGVQAPAAGSGLRGRMQHRSGPPGWPSPWRRSRSIMGAVVVGILLLMIRTDNGFARLDLRLAEFGPCHASDASTSVMRTISLLGGTAGIVVAALVVAGIESLRTRSRSVVAFVATVVAGQFLVSNLVKWSVDRARPAIDQLTGFAGTSFPSGHATAAAATYAAFAPLLGRGRPDAVKALFVGGAASIALLSRRPGCSSGCTGSPTWSAASSSGGPGSRSVRSCSVAAGCVRSPGRDRRAGGDAVPAPPP